jgi:hypothetical protein
LVEVKREVGRSMAEFTGTSEPCRHTPDVFSPHHGRIAPDRLSPLIASKRSER